MKQTHLIFAFTIALVASSASAGFWDSIKKVGGDAVSTTVGIATSAADAAVKASSEKTAEKAAATAEETQAVASAAVQASATVQASSAPAVPAPSASAVPSSVPQTTPMAVQAPSAPTSASAAAVRPAASATTAVQPAATPAASTVQPTAPAAAQRSSRRASMRAATTDSDAEREAYYAAERKKREEAQREEERKMAELLAKREAERDAAAKRRADAMREELKRRKAEEAAEREARQKRMEEERRAAQEKAEREAREARERMMRERYEKAFAFHQKAHAEAAGNADGYVYKPIAFWDGVKLAMTEEEAYAALTNAHPLVSSWHTNSVPNGAKWIDGTVRTVALPNGRLNLTFAAGETRGLRLLVGAKAVFANAANTTNVVASADVCGRFAKLENVAADKTRAAIDWTWKDGVNDFWRALHDEIARKLERAGEKSLERLSRDRDTIRAEFMDATYEVTDKFTVDGVEIRVVSAEANGAVRLVTVMDVALNKAFGIPESLALADVNANDGASATDRAAANAVATKGSATANDGVSSGGEADKPANEASPMSDRRRNRRGR